MSARLRIPLTFQDAAFLRAETSTSPTHVAGIEEYRIPADRPDFVADLVAQLMTQKVAPFWRRKLASGDGVLPLQPAWIEDEAFELDYHVRRIALPQPGSRVQLERIVERLHARPLDRNRPLWECYIIEGLAGDGRPGSRFAVYVKVSHALVDGMAGVGLVLAKLARDDAAAAVAPWSVDAPAAEVPAPRRALDRVRDAVRDIASLQRLGLETGLDWAARGLGARDAADLPFAAPSAPFNTAIDAHRTIVTRSLPMDRVRAVAKAADATINDLAVALTGAALRKWLDARGELPERSLIASCPVSVRSGSGVGNNVSVLLADLATDVEDPLERLQRAKASTRRGKRQIGALSQGAAESWATLFGLAGLAASAPGIDRIVPPAANLVLSNVPGPREARFFGGAELVGYYPVSVVVQGQGLNVTLLSRAGGIDFGITAARSVAPDLSLLGDALVQALEDLEGAVGVDLAKRTSAFEARPAAAPTLGIARSVG